MLRRGRVALVAILACSVLSPALVAGAPVDLTGSKPKPFDATMAAALDSYVSDLMVRSRVPGASVAIVQDGKIVYMEGFGVREEGTTDRVTPGTLMRIGSTGKSMTTMMMATLVDDGIISWDTPAVSIYPDFAVSAPDLTPKVTLKDLVCDCTGLQRHDIEIFFADSLPSPDDVIHSVRSFAFVGQFERTFGYVNQMVAAGGYIAARAASPQADLLTNYIAQMRQRVFDPIGMTKTTFDFDRVLADSDFATPHGLTADYTYVPISIASERQLEPIAPAGGSWSNASDMARYLITQLNAGVAPDGKRVVSAGNLEMTWRANLQLSPTTACGLGWGIGQYKGQRMLNHGGATLGFASDLTFLPDAGVGIVVLTNAQSANVFGAAVRYRALELAFGQPMEMDAPMSDRLVQSMKQHSDVAANVLPLDAGEVAPYLGSYTNSTLGTVRLEMRGKKLFLHAAQFESELRSIGENAFLVWDPPLASLTVNVSKDKNGALTATLVSTDPDQPGQWTFSKIVSGRP
jgi:CubicO group peptidase (beta-lactamase class C family)